MSYIFTQSAVTKTLPQNQPAPSVNPRIQEELTRIGGVVPSSGGENAGKPIYRLVWGQSHRHFERGKMRLQFVDEDAPKLVKQERFYLAPEILTQVAKWQAERDINQTARVLKGDYSVFAEFKPLSNFLKENISSLQYLALEPVIADRAELDSDVQSIAAVSAPADWIYYSDIAEIIEIGKPLWYIVRWISGKAHGHQRTWDRLRWVENAYVPEIDSIVPLVDNTGPFPENGVYIPRFEIADYEDSSGNFAIEYATTFEPCWQNCIEAVQEELYEEATRNTSKLALAQAEVDKTNNQYQQKLNHIASVNKEISEKMGVDPILTVDSLQGF